MVKIENKDVEYLTGYKLFPKVKVKFIDNEHYRITVKANPKQDTYWDFVILKNTIFNGFGYMVNKEYLSPSDYFNCNEDDFEEKVMALSEKILCELYRYITSESNNVMVDAIMKRHLTKQDA